MKIVRPQIVTDAVLTSSNVPENDYPAWSASTTYAQGDHVLLAATHRVYRSLQNNNLARDPAAEADPENPVYWITVGATNRWRMFDDTVSAQTSAADSVAVTLTTTDRADSVVLLNVSAAAVRVTVTDAADGLVFDQTYSMVSDSGIQDWYSYFFEPIVRKTDLAVTGLPPYSGAQVAVTVSDPGAIARVGECVVGLSRKLGAIQYGARLGIRDYSVKTQDDFGNYTILERNFSRRGSFSLWVDGGMVTQLQTILAGFRATPIAYIGSDTVDATIIYGFFKDFDVDLAYPNAAICSIEIEGLT